MASAETDLSTAVGRARRPLLTRRQRQRRASLVAYSFIAPNFIGFAVFTLGPIVFAFALAFMHWDGSNPIDLRRARQFLAAVLATGVFIAAFWNTIIYTALLGAADAGLRAGAGGPAQPEDLRPQFLPHRRCSFPMSPRWSRSRWSGT